MLTLSDLTTSLRNDILDDLTNMKFSGRSRSERVEWVSTLLDSFLTISDILDATTKHTYSIEYEISDAIDYIRERLRAIEDEPLTDEEREDMAIDTRIKMMKEDKDND
jgi:hypothetical protein